MILNDLPSRDKGHHIMVTKILKENYQKYYKRLTKNMQRYSITSSRDYLKEQHMMVTKVLKGNTKNYLNILNDLSSWDNEQHRMLTSIFWKIGSEKIEIKSELISYDKILYSFPVVDFLES